MRHFLCVCLIALVIIALSPMDAAAENTIPKNVAAVLEVAGDNAPELQKVLDHYTKSGDTLKYQAACFLIGNMEGHKYVIFKFVDTAGETVEIDPLAYPDYDSLMADIYRIEDTRGEIDYEKDTVIEDVKAITADYLIENIDLAFEAWRTKPWATGLPFETFCEGVLPYRGSSEPLESWRREFMTKYANIADQMTDPSDAAKAATIINKDIRTWFGFDERFYLHPTDQGLREMLSNGLGRCEDMTNLAIYAMRANGLAVTSDYTPHWANSDGNHAWNALIMPDGSVLPLMGAEADPGEYSLSAKVGKAYRKAFGQQPGNLAFVKDSAQKVPRWLGGKSYKDVTSSYTTVSDVVIKFSEPVPDSVPFAYLCVFNSGDWRAIHWGKVEDQMALFTDMGTGVAYLPMFYLNEELVPAGSPFVLEDDGSMGMLIGHPDEQVALALVSETRRTIEKSTTGVVISALEPGKSYELFYWEDGWQTVGEGIAGEGPLEFAAPAGVLYRLVSSDSRDEERIFTWDGGQQIWW
ncbi:MAG: transglutaminase-like domain-containing protein [candidate division Zixibacteria bacterium]|nr:transglutaminase-like domain-containing protein [candidate division Zixibacteria bacterium]